MPYTVKLSVDLKRNTSPGCFIALEGIDGSGKSTQAESLKKALEKMGKKVSVRNPFEGEIGKFTRKILKGEKKVPPIALQYLISANRAVQQVEIQKLLKSGYIVIIDRYYWSAVAYGMLDHQELGNDDASSWLLIGQSILSQYHQFISPDYTFYLDISSRTAKRRIDEMGKEKEIYENTTKIRKIEEIYSWLATKFPKEFTLIDGEQPIEKVTQDMLQIIEPKIKK